MDLRTVAVVVLVLLIAATAALPFAAAGLAERWKFLATVWLSGATAVLLLLTTGQRGLRERVALRLTMAVAAGGGAWGLTSWLWPEHRPALIDAVEAADADAAAADADAAACRVSYCIEPGERTALTPDNCAAHAANLEASRGERNALERLCVRRSDDCVPCARKRCVPRGQCDSGELLRRRGAVDDASWQLSPDELLQSWSMRAARREPPLTR